MKKYSIFQRNMLTNKDEYFIIKSTKEKRKENGKRKAVKQNTKEKEVRST